MITRVPRAETPPPGDPTSFIASSDRILLDDIADLSEYPDGFGLTFSSAVSNAELHCLHDPTADKSETWEAWVAAMQVGSALFAAAVTTEESVECRIAHASRTLPAIGAQHFTDAGNWVTAFWLAIVCRDQERMTRLCEVPVAILRASGAVYDEYVYDWVDALQAYWLERPGLGDKFTAAFEGTDPERVRVADRELMLKILYPPLNLFLQFLKRDEEQFNAALVQALRLHKEYWNADQDRRESISGTVALGPLAVACLAYDVGMSIQVESEYLPRHLLERAWVGEFET
ncbi:immunity 49 family protein [Streptomyces caniscabiei]|uniref:Immunity 49 family protein n=1 Tax=Streptomyces caniscabiei TaxID=2746961 RepID=A0A927QF86_9ACTN|nr:immunity 49 family protein [Streptomyces caniscabiei]MBD9701085.1 immunity 49 family protein [Streptomyces caniscabiei]MBD9724768.1 immunity 49 family protein [Streptomyces caniscabiei]MDX3510661.1 immunity 49 family protein [Streptomyces caniscabiei]MDX3720744.1 immunity 49 family protein [Streptomyces caniscabiei]MDX3732600.1 immunity 49 family protein [Streptomyces caniscabiei]